VITAPRLNISSGLLNHLMTLSLAHLWVSDPALEVDFRIGVVFVEEGVLLLEQVLHLLHELLVFVTHSAQSALMASVVVMWQGWWWWWRIVLQIGRIPHKSIVLGNYKEDTNDSSSLIVCVLDLTWSRWQSIDGIWNWTRSVSDTSH
jgi:hypothetical protein